MAMNSVSPPMLSEEEEQCLKESKIHVFLLTSLISFVVGERQSQCSMDRSMTTPSLIAASIALTIELAFYYLSSKKSSLIGRLDNSKIKVWFESLSSQS